MKRHNRPCFYHYSLMLEIQRTLSESSHFASRVEYANYDYTIISLQERARGLSPIWRAERPVPRRRVKCFARNIIWMVVIWMGVPSIRSGPNKLSRLICHEISHDDPPNRQAVAAITRNKPTYYSQGKEETPPPPSPAATATCHLRIIDDDNG